MLMVAIPRVIVIEETLGMTTGHLQAAALVEHYLERMEGPRRRTAEPPTSARGKTTAKKRA
jgi:hypothetical protein